MSVQAPTQNATMRAAVYHEYGTPEVLEVRELEKPVPAEDEVLVRVHAAAVNPFDWHMLTGLPYIARLGNGLRRPKTERLGADFAGTVEAVGANVTSFETGDDVFGVRNGAFGEYLCVVEDRAIVPKPANATFEQAAAVGVAAITALQGLRDKASVGAGSNVLINGASGGVGTFAIQIAKSLGARRDRRVQPAERGRRPSLGADRVIDYTNDDFTRTDERYDVILDIPGNRSWKECRRIMSPNATLVCVGGPKTNRLYGPLGKWLPDRLASVLTSQNVAIFVAKPDKDDLATLGELIEAGSVTSVIDRQYELGDLGDALTYLAQGHARGKVVITV